MPMNKKEPYQKVALWFFIIIGPYWLFIMFLLGSIFSSYSSDFKQWSLILSSILYGGLFFFIIRRVKSKVPCISKVSDKRTLFLGAKYLFIRPQEPSVTIIYEGGEQRKLRLISTIIHRRKFKSDILELWRVWKEGIAEKEIITRFEYPECYRKNKTKAVWADGIAMACFGVFFSILCFYSIFDPKRIKITDNSDSLGLAIIFAILVFASSWCIFYVYKERKIVHFIRIADNAEKIEVEYENGETKTFNKDDIKKYSYPSFSRSGAVVKFKDGTRFENLDRVSYWPVLKERLIGN